jgi:hypothetical protein
LHRDLIVDAAGGHGRFAAARDHNSSGSGTLTVTDGTRTAHLALLGQYTVTDFLTAADGQGGTLIMDPPFSTGAEIAARR